MRACETCSLCCKLLAIHEVPTAAGSWCRHVVKGGGCANHDHRPAPCRAFACQYLRDETLPEDWRPTRAKLFVHADGDARTWSVEVDPGSPLAWRAQPYYGQLKRWAEAARTGDGRVLVYVGARAWAVFPETDIDIGQAAPGDIISTGYRRTPGGMTPFVRVDRQGAVTEYI